MFELSITNENDTGETVNNHENHENCDGVDDTPDKAHEFICRQIENVFESGIVSVWIHKLGVK